MPWDGCTPTPPLHFIPPDSTTAFPHLEAIECARRNSIITIGETHLLRCSPNLRVFLVNHYQDHEPKPNFCSFKYLKGCYIDTLMSYGLSYSNVGSDLEDTNQLPRSSQTPFPHLRSLHFLRTSRVEINRSLCFSGFIVAVRMDEEYPRSFAIPSIAYPRDNLLSKLLAFRIFGQE